MSTDLVMLICSKCSLRVRGMNRSDVPERGIVCRCGYRMLPGTIKADPGRRKPAPLPECSLRGDQLSIVDCQCAGKVSVYACTHADNTEGLAISHRGGGLRGLPEDSLPSCRQCPFNREQGGAGRVGDPPPSLLTMASTAITAGARFIAGRGRVVSRDDRAARMATCKDCPSLNGSQCVECGCLVAIKTWLPKEECPLKKWLKITPQKKD